jgi:hypothetical protein
MFRLGHDVAELSHTRRHQRVMTPDTTHCHAQSTIVTFGVLRCFVLISLVL